MKRLAPVILAVTLASSAAGCYGSYGAFNSVHKWNGQVTGSKVTNSIIHFALWVIPVYELALLGDFVIFNNVEFITDKPVFRP